MKSIYRITKIKKRVRIINNFMSINGKKTKSRQRVKAKRVNANTGILALCT